MKTPIQRAPARVAAAEAEDDATKGQIRLANEIRILGAAEKVFARAGFGGATMAAIATAQGITAEADPRAALEQYIRVKMALSAQRPDGSKVFANEMLHGAPVVKTILKSELRPLVMEKAAVIQGWIDAARMAPVDPTHLFFTIWAATQTYADFDVQVCAVLGRKSLTAKDHARATEHVVSLLMRGCGL